MSVFVPPLKERAVDERLVMAVNAMDEVAVRELLAEGVDPSKSEARCLKLAVANGFVSGVRLLAPLCSGDDCSSALGTAARKGYLGCVEALIPYSDVEGSRALHWSVWFFDVAITQLLIPLSDCESHLENFRKAGRGEQLEFLKAQMDAVALMDKVGEVKMSSRSGL